MSATATEQVIVETSDMTLVIPDIKKPTWYGDYHNGKLAIYHCQVVKGEKPDSITVLTIYTDEEGQDFVVSASYEAAMGFEEITSHICANVIIAYQQQKAIKATPSIYVPGPTISQ